MSAILLIVAALAAGLPLCFVIGYREGWDHGYGSGYDERDAETLYGEKPGTRRGRTSR